MLRRRLLFRLLGVVFLFGALGVALAIWLAPDKGSVMFTGGCCVGVVAATIWTRAESARKDARG